MSFPADNPNVFPTAIKKANVPDLSSKNGNLGEGEWNRINTLEQDGRVKLAKMPTLQEVTLDLKIDGTKIIIAFQDAAKEVVSIAFDKKLLGQEIKDYALIIQTYYAAIRTAKPPIIQQIDMGRREIHNMGAEKLQTILRKEGAELGLNAARCMFYLIANRLG
jgi:Uncharacterised protein family (UPF0262)